MLELLKLTVKLAPLNVTQMRNSLKITQCPRKHNEI